MYKNIVVIVPTEGEGRNLSEMLPEGVSLVVGGVGLAEIAAATSVEIARKPDLIILAGIAGAYPGSGLAVGECVVVESERIADLGAFRNGRFTPLYEKEYACPMAEGVKSFDKVVSLTVNTASSDHISFSPQAQIENMEGASFFALCNAHGVECLQVRAISNMTTDVRADWRIPQAIESLTNGVLALIKELRER